MNNFTKMAVSLFLTVFATLSASAANLDSVIKKSNFDKTSTIAVSVKDVSNGHVVYEYNQNKLMNPASVQKMFSMRSAYKELGADYTFKTAVYVDGESNLYIKLGADPTLTTGSLTSLLKSVKEKYNKPVNDVVIDSSVIDNKQWGIGWMWDDDASSVLPKYSPFSINENKITVTIQPEKNSIIPEVKAKSNYQMMLVNKLKKGDMNKLVIERQPWLTSDATTLSGTVNSVVKLKLPVDSPERYFITELKSSLASAGIKTSGAIKVAPKPANAKFLTEISSVTLTEIVGDTLKNSNNFNSEMIFKAAASHYTKSTGTTENAVKMYENYFSDIKNDNHIVVDACGISRNNLMTADWITSALNKIYKEDDFDDFSKLLAKPMEGTLSNRLLDISLKLRAKTGTASGISSIAGYVDSKSGKKYSFAIIIQNHNENTEKVKNFEDEIIKEIYKM